MVSFKMTDNEGKEVKFSEVLRMCKLEILIILILLIGKFYNYGLTGESIKFSVFSMLLFKHITFLNDKKQKPKFKQKKNNEIGININLSWVIIIFVIIMMISTCLNILNLLY